MYWANVFILLPNQRKSGYRSMTSEGGSETRAEKEWTWAASTAAVVFPEPPLPKNVTNLVGFWGGLRESATTGAPLLLRGRAPLRIRRGSALGFCGEMVRVEEKGGGTNRAMDYRGIETIQWTCKQPKSPDFCPVGHGDIPGVGSPMEGMKGRDDTCCCRHIPNRANNILYCSNGSILAK